MKHTPTPWYLENGGFQKDADEQDRLWIMSAGSEDHLPVLTMVFPPDPAFDEEREKALANTQLIVKCVNGYEAATRQIEALRTALEEVMAWSFGTGAAEQCGAKCSTRTEAEDMARAALQSAKEGQA